MGQNLKTFALLTGITVLFMVIGNMVGGQQGMTTALLMAAVMNLGAYWFSDKIVLSMYRAKVVTEAEAPELYRIVRNLVDRAGLPMPRLAIIPTEAANAFATGRNPKHATVAVTQGILRILNHDELEGVLAHELAHVKHRDILISTIAATFAGAIMWLVRFFAFFGGGGDRDRNPLAGIAMLIVGPLAAMLVQSALSRSREFAADAGGAKMVGHPNGLASALEKLHGFAASRGPMQASPATSHMFIVKPFSGRSLANLFSTHPPIEERVQRLRANER